MTSIGRRLRDQRESLILAQAAPYLEDGERVLRWVRGRSTDGRGEGFVFLTHRRVVIHWTGGKEAPRSFEWKQITGWGVVEQARGGPILGIERDEDTSTVQLRSTTRAMGERVAEFVEEFSSNVPFAREPLKLESQEGSFEPKKTVELPPHRMSWTDHGKRVGITVLGSVLLFLGVILSLPGVPGPGLLVVIAGLAVLAQEYDWAKDARDWVKGKYKAVAQRIKRKGSD